MLGEFRQGNEASKNVVLHRDGRSVDESLEKEGTKLVMVFILFVNQISAETNRIFKAACFPQLLLIGVRILYSLITLQI